MKFRPLVLSLFLLIFIVQPIRVGYTNSTLELERQISETRRTRDALLEEQRQLERELATLNQQGQSLSTAVKSLDATRKKLTNDLNLTRTKISSANLNIKNLESSMYEKENQIVNHEKAIATALQRISEYSSHSLLVDVFAYEKLSDVWRNRAALEDVSSHLLDNIQKLRETKLALAEEKDRKERTKEELESLGAQLNGQKKVVEENQNVKARLLAETKNKEAEYQKLLELNIARQKQSEADLYRLESALKITLDPSLYPEPRRGLLSWPLDYVYVTQQFGRTAGASRLYASGSHNGVDFRASMGTPVRAMLEGVVEGAGNTDDQRGCYSYGRWILIKHANGLSTVYAHLSASLVKTGDTVKTGQVIAYSGGTPGVNGSGYSTGPHLHVGLFASQGVGVRQFTTSINCKQVFIPLADVSAYLDPLAYLPLFQ